MDGFDCCNEHVRLTHVERIFVEIFIPVIELLFKSEIQSPENCNAVQIAMGILKRFAEFVSEHFKLRIQFKQIVKVVSTNPNPKPSATCYFVANWEVDVMIDKFENGLGHHNATYTAASGIKTEECRWTQYAMRQRLRTGYDSSSQQDVLHHRH